MIAFLGTGLLGANFVRALRTHGEDVNVWNRSPDNSATLEATGARAFTDPASCVKGATRIHLTLVDDAVVDDVLSRAAPGIARGAYIVDLTTTSPEGARSRAADWARRDIRYVHAPVFMGPPNALNGTGSMMVSGAQEDYDALASALERMTGKLIYLGTDPGRAAGIKLIGNQLIVSMTTALSDSLALARGAGIPEEEVSGLLEFFNPGSMLPARLTRLLARDYDNPSWTLSMARKDVRLMLEAAGSEREALVALPAIAESMDKEIAQRGCTQDYSGVTRRAVNGS